MYETQRDVIINKITSSLSPKRQLTLCHTAFCHIAESNVRYSHQLHNLKYDFWFKTIMAMTAVRSDLSRHSQG